MARSRVAVYMSNTDARFVRRKRRARAIAVLLAKRYPHIHGFLTFRSPWELLVAVVLSAQCTDKKVNEVTATLFKKYRTLHDYVRAKPEEFAQDIRPTGFYKNKTKHILAAARILEEKFGGVVPKTMQELVTLPGVGRKTANVVLSQAYGIVAGIAVDTHVQRLARVWELTDEADPERIEQDLMALLPRRAWPLFTLRAIAYGREYCPAKAHDHAQCPVSLL